MNSDYYIYILFRENGTPFYVGKGRNNRWTFHERTAHKFNDHKSRIIRKILKTQLDVPKIKIAEGLTNKQAQEREVLFIAAIGRYPNGPLVNHTQGGDGCVDPSQDVRDRMSKSHKGIPLSLETRVRMSAAAKGVLKTREHSDKVAAANRGKKRSPETCAKFSIIRRNISDESRQKMRDSHLGHSPSEATRKKIGDSSRGRKYTPEQNEVHRQHALNCPQSVKDRIAETMRKVWAERKAAGIKINVGARRVQK